MNIAFITQTYKPDFNECKMLCRSMDIFANTYDHFIFVNDEDINHFNELNYGRHHVLKKSTILPSYFIRLPFKLLGHHFYVSPFSIPMREWIMQQICKLGVFDVIGDVYDAVFNIDSESVFLKPLDINLLINGGKFRLFRNENTELEVAHADYCRSIDSIFGGTLPRGQVYKYNYMDMPVCFVRTNMKQMLADISKHSIFKNWILALANRYRFSENYLYGNYCVNKLCCRNHFLTNKKIMPVLQADSYCTAEDLYIDFQKALDEGAVGVVLQKSNRKENLDYIGSGEVWAAIKLLNDNK